MVYMSGGKMARHQASITNRFNCGGPKKTGLSGGIGGFLQFNVNKIRGNNTQYGEKCDKIGTMYPVQRNRATAIIY